MLALILGGFMSLSFGSMTGGIAGSLFSSAFDVWAGRQAAEDQRAFDERAYRHRYQWQMEDMRKAGLNPMLAYMQSPGAGPSTTPAETGSMSRSMSSAAQMALVKSQIRLQEEQASSARQLARKTKFEADIVRKGIPKADVVEDIWSTARDVYKATKDAVKTYPLVPSEKPYRQAVKPLTERQREQLRNTGRYTRPARQR